MTNARTCRKTIFSAGLFIASLVCVSPTFGQQQDTAPSVKSKLTRNLIQFRDKLNQQLPSQRYRKPTGYGEQEIANQPAVYRRPELPQENRIRQTQFQQQMQQPERPFYPPQNQNQYPQPNEYPPQRQESHQPHNHEPMQNQAAFAAPQSTAAFTQPAHPGQSQQANPTPPSRDGFQGSHYSARSAPQPAQDQRHHRYQNQVPASQRVLMLTDELERAQQNNRSLDLENQRLKRDLQNNQNLLAEITQAVDNSVEKLNQANSKIQSLQQNVVDLESQLTQQKNESTRLLQDFRGQLNALIAQEISNGR